MARDIYSEMQKAKTKEEFDALARERYEKEQSLKKAGTWDESWVPTSQLAFGVEGYLPAAYPTGQGADTVQMANTVKNPYTQLSGQVNAQIDSRKKAKKQEVEENYQKLVQNAYIEKMQTLANLPAIMAKTGQTGGLAETTALVPQLAYGSALNQLGQSKAQALKEIDRSADEEALQYAIDFAKGAMAQDNAQRSYNYNVQRDMQADRQYEEKTAYDRAWKAATAGDFSFLKNLGVDTSGMEKEYNMKISPVYAKGGTSAKGESSGDKTDAGLVTTSDVLYKNAKAILENGGNAQRVADYLLYSAPPEQAAQYIKLLDLFGGLWKNTKQYTNLEDVVKSNLEHGKNDTAANLISRWLQMGEITRLDAIRMMVSHNLPLSGI